MRDDGMPGAEPDFDPTYTSTGFDPSGYGPVHPQPERRQPYPPQPSRPDSPRQDPPRPPERARFQPAEKPPRGRATVQGQVRGINERSETYNENTNQVLTFRIERYDAQGNRFRPVAVQLRSSGYDGSISEGDEVRVSGRYQDGVLHSGHIENLTTGSRVKPRSFGKQIVISLIIVALMIGGFASFVMISQNQFNESVQRNHQEFCDTAADSGLTSPPGC